MVTTIIITSSSSSQPLHFLLASSPFLYLRSGCSFRCNALPSARLFLAGGRRSCSASSRLLDRYRGPCSQALKLLVRKERNDWGFVRFHLFLFGLYSLFSFFLYLTFKCQLTPKKGVWLAAPIDLHRRQPVLKWITALGACHARHVLRRRLWHRCCKGV